MAIFGPLLLGPPQNSFFWDSNRTLFLFPSSGGVTRSGDRLGGRRPRWPTLGLGVSEGMAVVAMDENELQGDPKASIMAFLAVYPSEPGADCRDCYSLSIIDHLLGLLHEI